jgi:hypothetical protein
MSGGFVKISGIENAKSIKNGFVLTNKGELFAAVSPTNIISTTNKQIEIFSFSKSGLIVKDTNKELEIIDKNFDPNADPYEGLVNNFVIKQYFNDNGGLAYIYFQNPDDPTWNFSEIRRKLGSYPQNRDDGDFVAKVYKNGLVKVEDTDPIFTDINSSDKYFYTVFPVNNEFVASVGHPENEGVNSYIFLKPKFEQYEISLDNPLDKEMLNYTLELQLSSDTVSNEFDKFEINVINNDAQIENPQLILNF